MKQPHLLVVDDEPDIGKLVQKHARRIGYRVTIATSAEEFHRSLSREKPDVIVIDMVMPGVDGIELINDLARLEAKSSIILISGYNGKYLAPAEHLGRANGLKMLGTLEKPFRPPELKKLLEQAVPGNTTVFD